MPKSRAPDIMNKQTATHVKKIRCDHGTTCHSCNALINPSEDIYMEGRKELCGTCGKRVVAAWDLYYQSTVNA